MKVIARPVGTGKTRELAIAAALDNGLILTTNKRALQAKVQAYGIIDVEIIDLNDLLYGNYDKNKPLYIHKMDDVINEYLEKDFSLKLAGYSVALED